MNFRKIKDIKYFLMILLIIIVILLMLSQFDFRGGTSFEIEDKCGQFMNLLSHTIGDEAACKSRCKSQCVAIDYKYDKVDFKITDSNCNLCTCYCR